MKKAISIALAFIMIVCVVCSCSFLPDEIKVCKVNFYVDGQLYQTKTVNIGQTVSAPKSPTKENQIFVGWSTEGLFSFEYDFSNIVISDLNLYAYFTLDAVALTNMVTTQSMKSLVSITNKSYNTAMGGLLETSSSTAQGSGVVLDVSGGYCFVLTNYHVIAMIEGYSHQTLTVEDPWGNKYNASIYKNSKISSSAMDSSYDLALIYFHYTRDEDPLLQEIEIETDPSVGDYVISLGAPMGQKNSITYGKVLNYQRLNTEDDNALANVTFDIILHNAIIDHGSSGGPLLNSSGKLVGINFAGYESNNYGCAIPISKVNQFLNKYVYVK